MVTVSENKRRTTRPYTRAHVLKSIESLGKLAEKAGVKEKSEKWVLVVGSHKYNQPWELKYVDGHGEFWMPFLAEGFLGWTATQSCKTLQNVQLAWQYMIDKQEGR